MHDALMLVFYMLPDAMMLCVQFKSINLIVRKDWFLDRLTFSFLEPQSKEVLFGGCMEFICNPRGPRETASAATSCPFGILSLLNSSTYETVYVVASTFPVKCVRFWSFMLFVVPSSSFRVVQSECVWFCVAGSPSKTLLIRTLVELMLVTWTLVKLMSMIWTLVELTTNCCVDEVLPRVLVFFLSV